MTKVVAIPALPAAGVRPLHSAADLARCVFCGQPSLTKNGLCRGHDDLGFAR